MKKHFLSWNRLALFYMIFALVPVIFLTVFSIDKYRTDIRSLENTLLEYSGLQTVSNLESAFKESKQVVAQLVTDNDVIKTVQSFDAPTSGNTAAIIKSKLKEKISDYSCLNPYITGVAILGYHFDPIFMTRSDTSVFSDALLQDSDFKKYLMEYGAAAYLREIHIMDGYSFPSAPSTDAIFFTYPLVDLITQHIYGVVIFEFDSSLFLSIMYPKTESPEIQSRFSSYSAITDSTEKVLVSSNADAIGKRFSDISASDENYILQSSSIGKTGLTLNLVFFKGPLQQYLNNFQHGLFIYLSVVSVLFLFSLMMNTHRIWKNSVQMENMIRAFRKDPLTPIKNFPLKDELLDEIGKQIQKMSHEISTLLQELEAKNEHIKEVAARQKKAELKAMEAQINPHFLYNALDRINWIAIDNGQYEISDMLSGLGSLLRYSLYNIDTLVTLRAELKWMERYIFIQSKRFGRDIAFLSDVSDEAIDFPTHKMLLQPLVENSILRGFYDDPADPVIQISAEVLSSGNLQIHLSDNGCGINAEQLQKLNAIIDSRGEESSDGIGVCNTVSRLSLYYGDNYSINVKSILGEGTEFTIEIPYTTSNL